jgi:hypothetical protein
MPLFEPLYPARYAAPLLEFLRNAPADCLQAALAAAQIEEEVFRQAEYALTMAQVDALVSAASLQLGRTDLGFELGRRIKMDHHLGLGVILRRCRSIDELLRMLCRFYRLVTPSFTLHYQRRRIYLPAGGLHERGDPALLRGTICVGRAQRVPEHVP